MQRNTITTLGELRVGDRFSFVKKNEVWQVTAIKKNTTCFNKFDGKARLLKFDEEKRSTVQVFFLRHTIPVPGEECMIEDLKPGDIFTTFAGDAEWCVREQFTDSVKETKVVRPGTFVFSFIKHGLKVHYVRHKEIVNRSFTDRNTLETTYY